MNYNRWYPVKVWLAGAAPAGFCMGLIKTTLNDFTPAFITSFLFILVSLPFFLVFSVVFLILKKMSLSFKKAKLILILITSVCIAVPLTGQFSLDSSLKSSIIAWFVIPLVCCLPFVAGILYFEIDGVKRSEEQII
ncbi:hypothetical protein [Pedobacter cryoconitis]|uniref:Uncharacterized protein n=1 Tax=Pedobacter cryoconitis TaxID=188932 RepID=A0A7X0J8A1_9SPHI|nr:hypothetical protein [Pedobacter cryoconitis]MBB6502494.1 hypothetical protein [Pedobacter cryoconitis]